MPIMLLFQRAKGTVDLRPLSDKMNEQFGVGCAAIREGSRVPDAELAAAGTTPFSADFALGLPEGDEEDGEPVATVEIVARAQRDETIQGLVDEILEQDDSLADAMNKNTNDILVTYDDTPAGEESATILAYLLATDTDSGILIPAADDDEDTVWFDTAADFFDAMFDDGDDDDYEEGDDEGEVEESDDDAPSR